MDDADIVQRIGRLAAEEHSLEGAHIGQPPPDDELDRLHGAEVALDQCWDLLRQRRARRSAGLDPKRGLRSHGGCRRATSSSDTSTDSDLWPIRSSDIRPSSRAYVVPGVP